MEFRISLLPFSIMRLQTKLFPYFTFHLREHLICQRERPLPCAFLIDILNVIYFPSLFTSVCNPSEKRFFLLRPQWPMPYFLLVHHFRLYAPFAFYFVLRLTSVSRWSFPFFVTHFPPFSLAPLPSLPPRGGRIFLCLHPCLYDTIGILCRFRGENRVMGVEWRIANTCIPIVLATVIIFFCAGYQYTAMLTTLSTQRPCK